MLEIILDGDRLGEGGEDTIVVGNGAARVQDGAAALDGTIVVGNGAAALDFFDPRPDTTDFFHIFPILRLPKLTWEQNLLGTTTGPPSTSPRQTRRPSLEENAKNYLFLLLRRLLASSRQDEDKGGGTGTAGGSTGVSTTDVADDGTSGTISNGTIPHSDYYNDVLSFVRSAVLQHLLEYSRVRAMGEPGVGVLLHPPSPFYFLSAQEKEEIGISEDEIQEIIRLREPRGTGQEHRK